MPPLAAAVLMLESPVANADDARRGGLPILVPPELLVARDRAGHVGIDHATDASYRPHRANASRKGDQSRS